MIEQMASFLEEVMKDTPGYIERKQLTSKVRVRCEICQEVIATIGRNTIEAPIAGWMFESPDPFHDFPKPFDDSLDWEAMRCPHCRTRPFMAEDPATCVIILLESHEHIQVRNKPHFEPKETLVASNDSEHFSDTEIIAYINDGIKNIKMEVVEGEQQEENKTEGEGQEVVVKKPAVDKKAVKVFICKQCGKTAKSGAGLARHMRIHKMEEWRKKHGRA